MSLLKSLLLRCVCVLVLLFYICMGGVYAQNSKKVKDLKAKKTLLQKDLKKSQQALAKTGKDVKDGKSYLHHIDRQLEDRIEHIRTMEGQMDSIETEVKGLRKNIKSLDKQLTDKKQRYIRALRFSYQFPRINNTLIFDKCEELDLNDDIKLPKIHKEDGIKLLKDVINKEWRKEHII